MNLQKKAKAITTVLTTYNYGVDFYRTVRRTYNDKINYKVKVNEGSRLYTDTHRWLEGLLDESRVLRATTWDKWDDVDDLYKTKLAMVSDTEKARRFVYKGHNITVRTEQSEDVGSHGGMAKALKSFVPKTLVFTTSTAAGQRAIIDKLEQLVADDNKKPSLPRLFLAKQTGFVVRDDIPNRNLDSVILKSGQIERVSNDLENFLQAEANYVCLGSPWHRGYLFHGPPGTGKTSLAQALASYFKLDLWYIPLNDIQQDTNLISLVADIPHRGVLLLEDIDTVNATTVRNKEGRGMSMSALLNVLDGVVTPHGLITIMTTNDKSSLDPAILRSGRIDVTEYIGAPDSEQLERYYKMFFKRDVKFEGVPKISMADAAEIFKLNMYNPENAAAQIQDKLCSS